MKEEKLSKFEAGVLFNPLAPEFYFGNSRRTINAGDKMAAPR